MTNLLDRLKRALADRYRIQRELGSGGIVATDSRGPSTSLRINSADVAESDIVYDSVARPYGVVSDAPGCSHA
jgi:hypothetical protein